MSGNRRCQGNCLDGCELTAKPRDTDNFPPFPGKRLAILLNTCNFFFLFSPSFFSFLKISRSQIYSNKTTELCETCRAGARTLVPSKYARGRARIKQSVSQGSSIRRDRLSPIPARKHLETPHYLCGNLPIVVFLCAAAEYYAPAPGHQHSSGSRPGQT